MALLRKYETEEKQLFRQNVLDVKIDGPMTTVHAVPPPPILLSRTHSTMVFKPVTFHPASGEVVTVSFFMRYKLSTE